MEICHITLTSQRRSRLALFPDEGAYRLALHRLGRTCAGILALFALIADHLHLVALASRSAAGRLAQAISLALRPVVHTPLAPADIEPVTTRSHMRWLLKYMLEQPSKHGMPGHPALWVGSCLPELLGARCVAGLTLRIREALPDYRNQTALRLVGLPVENLPLPDRDRLQAAGPQRIVNAAAAAFAVDSTLRRNDAATRAARRAAAQLARRTGIRTAAIADAMQLDVSTICHLTRRRADRDAVLCVARRVALEDLVVQQQVTGVTATLIHGG